MLFGGVLALIIRAQLAVPDNDLVSAGMFNQVFTLHGTVMMFLFAVPIFEAVAIRLLPDMMGARDLPFPRLSAYGFWRSEEHTSELQSLMRISSAVFCLKKTKTTTLLTQHIR